MSGTLEAQLQSGRRPGILALAALAFLLVVPAVGCSLDTGSRAGTISTVVGTGEPGNVGFGGPARETELQQPVDLAFDPDGNLYIAERFGFRILKVDGSDRVTVAAGTGDSGFSGDGGRATKAMLNGASAVAVDRVGNLYIADTQNNRIRMVDREGVIRTIAGNGDAAFSGDGGPAVDAALNGPAGMTFDAEGNLNVADLANHRIRRIDRQGTITTVAGGPSAGFSPDGTLAIGGRLGYQLDHLPLGMAIGPDGALVFTDYENSRIRKVDAEGRFRTLAGNGEISFSGDGGPATQASLKDPLDVAIDSDGNLYIAVHDHGDDSGGQRIRKVDSDGTITTIAGTGATGYTGDRGPATDATFNIPAAVEIGPDGNLYVADADNHVIRMIEL